MRDLDCQATQRREGIGAAHSTRLQAALGEVLDMGFADGLEHLNGNETRLTLIGGFDSDQHRCASAPAARLAGLVAAEIGVINLNQIGKPLTIMGRVVFSFSGLARLAP